MKDAIPRAEAGHLCRRERGAVIAIIFKKKVKKLSFFIIDNKAPGGSEISFLRRVIRLVSHLRKNIKRQINLAIVIPSAFYNINRHG
ncbi:hypothetical protein C2E15_03125 [Mixta gaviniae]|uniref:Uncharacterized protein n=1 Tax=Mixta gaviniae TaxID=665914 RepID=A0A2L0IC50_9GAMM|nr:hypothetical protein C2E15_03125 [Mixta gaviniae]